jgi:hypothetical protein
MFHLNFDPSCSDQLQGWLPRQCYKTLLGNAGTTCVWEIMTAYEYGLWEMTHTLKIRNKEQTRRQNNFAVFHSF